MERTFIEKNTEGSRASMVSDFDALTEKKNQLNIVLKCIASTTDYVHFLLNRETVCSISYSIIFTVALIPKYTELVCSRIMAR